MPFTFGHASMHFTLINKHKDKWVLTSAERVLGGGTIDAPPVRLIDHDDATALSITLKELLNEEHVIVPEPDWNERRFKVGIRVDAVGLRSWRTFVRHTRAFKLEARANDLLLEEWPRDGYSFSAKPVWQRTFPPDRFDLVAEHLIALK
jgi:hypothetical protein